MPLAPAELWTARLVGLAVLLQTLELLQLRHVMRDDGVWSWPVLRREHRGLPAPLRLAFAAILPYRPFLGLLILRLPCALALMAFGNSVVTLFLFGAHLASSVRFRGTFNGGSDSMTALILLASSIAWLLGDWPFAKAACLLFVAVELLLSYFVAGVAKAKERDWWSGAALRAFVLESRYGAPRWARAVVSRPWASAAVSLAVIGFECGFPLALTSMTASATLSVVGFCFHVGNALVFGLNRFLFAWAAAYPALWFASGFVQGVARS